VVVDIAALSHAAADLYAATGEPRAIAAAGLLREAAGNAAAPVTANAIPHLASAVQAVASSRLRGLLERAVGSLPWLVTEGDGIPPSIAGRLASAEIVGPDGAIAASTLRLGLLLQWPDADYPPHSHAAEELYLTLSGTPLWQKDDAPYAAVAPGSFVHHAPFQRHAMKTGAEPLLALWVWLGDLSFASYRFHGR